MAGPGRAKIESIAAFAFAALLAHDGGRSTDRFIQPVERAGSIVKPTNACARIIKCRSPHPITGQQPAEAGGALDGLHHTRFIPLLPRSSRTIPIHACMRRPTRCSCCPTDPNPIQIQPTHTTHHTHRCCLGKRTKGLNASLSPLSHQPAVDRSHVGARWSEADGQGVRALRRRQARPAVLPCRRPA